MIRQKKRPAAEKTAEKPNYNCKSQVSASAAATTKDEPPVLVPAVAPQSELFLVPDVSKESFKIITKKSMDDTDLLVNLHNAIV